VNNWSGLKSAPIIQFSDRSSCFNFLLAIGRTM
jgi:hypothetical protein